MPNRQISRLRMLGLLFCLLGGVLITLGWMGTAKHSYVDQQIPYLISGGAAGIGLIVVGVGLLLVAQLRAEFAMLATRLAESTRPEPADDFPMPARHAATADTEPIPWGARPDPESN